MHDLRARATSYVRNDLWHQARAGRPLSLQQWGLTAYTVLGAILTVGSLFLSFFFWQHLFGGLFSALWDGGLVSRVLLIVLTLVVLGPVVRALLAFARTLGRRARALWLRIRFRFETSWRVEAASMIDDLPAFEDLPVELLNDLAGRVTMRTYRSGQPVFRQGERATAFYVVRAGQVSVETVHPDTGDVRTLSVLQRGDSFGELGLVEAQPRSATVRALSEVELFEVDKGTFDHLLASALHVPTFALTLESLSELREIPVFASLPSDRLGDLLDVGTWSTVAPGVEVVVQGDVGDAFYAIRSGHADVVRDGVVVVALGAGDYFGEAALLNGTPRNATVVARTPMRVFRLPRSGFDAIVRRRSASRSSSPLPHAPWNTDRQPEEAPVGLLELSSHCRGHVPFLWSWRVRGRRRAAGLHPRPLPWRRHDQGARGRGCAVLREVHRAPRPHAAAGVGSLTLPRAVVGARTRSGHLLRPDSGHPWRSGPDGATVRGTAIRQGDRLCEGEPHGRQEHQPEATEVGETGRGDVRGPQDQAAQAEQAAQADQDVLSNHSIVGARLSVGP